MPEPGFNVTPAKKLTPEQKKLFSSMDTTASVFTEADINAVRDGGDEALANIMADQNAEAIAALGSKSILDAKQDEIQPFERATSENSDPNIQAPTRAQDQFTLRQSPTALMSGVPRMKFEYLATFRFRAPTDFEEIFRDDVTAIDDEIRINSSISEAQNPRMRSTINNNVNDLRNQRQGVLDDLRRSLVFNVRQIDGPKVNFQYDTLNQYNRKRNVYRRVDYDPVSVRFLDTMNNSALKLFKYLYELNLKDGRNQSKDYKQGNERFNKGLYQDNSLSDTTSFIEQHNFGLDNSLVGNSTYPIKSLDLFIVHGSKYNLIRFVHPKIISMDHDVLSYESSQPIEIGMQFAYETVIYETLNHEMSNAKDVAIDFDQIFENSLTMPETPLTAVGETEGSIGTTNNQYDWTKLSTSIPDEQSSATAGSGSNVINVGAFAHDINSAGAAFGGSLQNISGTPFTDAISKVSQEVYGATRSAVSSFSAGGVSGGGQSGNNQSFLGGLGDKFKNLGPGDGRYNPDSSNYQPPKGSTVKDSKGNIVKDSNGNAVRQGTSSSGNSY